MLLVGRNGAGKSTLLNVLAGETRPSSGSVVRRGEVALVPQQLGRRVRSGGEERLMRLRSAFESGAQMLLLDEPTEDLDDEAREWLNTRLTHWEGGLIVVSHDRRLLSTFKDFFLIEESGCRLVRGDLEEVEEELARDYQAAEERYLSRLSRLWKAEERTEHLARRRRRKEQYGRCRELDRGTPRSTLNQKRDQAQKNHGRINGVRASRQEEKRRGVRAARRALKVELPFSTLLAQLPASLGPVVQAANVGVSRANKRVVRSLDLKLDRERLLVTGPNGSGKTTLLEVLSGERKPDVGEVIADRARLGVIAQGGVDWMLDESLLELVESGDRAIDIETLTRYRFPLALAERPLRSLSPGERVRAALIALLQRSPTVEALVLDEPTYSLDLVGQKAMRELLAAWPGGLIVASHDEDLLEALRGPGVAEIDLSSSTRSL